MDLVSVAVLAEVVLEQVAHEAGAVLEAVAVQVVVTDDAKFV